MFKKYLKTQNNNFATDQNGKKLENVKYNEQSINDLITSFNGCNSIWQNF
nr:hypothetical protein [Mycoplasmopsis bovis]